MNIYTQLLNYFWLLADEDPFVNTITQGDFDKIDLDKGQLHPLLHIQVNTGGFPTESVITFNVQIGCFDNRDINKEIVEDRFWKQDNEVDNMNETLNTLNRLWLNMFRNFQNNNITASSATLDPTTLGQSKLVDGWIMTFDIEVPNTLISLCPGGDDDRKQAQAESIALLHMIRVNEDQGSVQDFNCLINQIFNLL